MEREEIAHRLVSFWGDENPRLDVGIEQLR